MISLQSFCILKLKICTCFAELIYVSFDRNCKETDNMPVRTKQSAKQNKTNPSYR